MDRRSKGLPASARKALEEQFGIAVRAVTGSLVGEESVGWRVETDRGTVAVQRFPAWRSPSDVAWVHERIAEIRAHVPEAVGPMRALDGSTLVPLEDGILSVFPFVVGEPLDPDDEALRIDAARLLSRMHVAGSSIEVPPRPMPPWGRPEDERSVPDDPVMVDPELAAWERTLTERRLVRGLIHGDFYPRNVLCRDGRVAGVIDWMETDVAPLVYELGWVLWEFSQNAAGDDLDVERARRFLGAYRAAGGRVPPSEDEHLVPAMRRRLRLEVRRSSAEDAAQGEGLTPDAYRDAEIRAFPKLRDLAFG